jgi:chaperonin cofactor prefoldin
LQAQLYEAHEAFGDTVDTATRTRYNNTVKKTTKSLSVKIKGLANMLKKKIAEHQDLLKDISLERKENEHILKHIRMSLDCNLEDALRREKVRAVEELAMRTSELEDHIVALSRQLKVVEAKLVELQNAGTSPFVPPILAPISCSTTIPCGTRTPFPTTPSLAAPTKPLDSNPYYSRACEGVCDTQNTDASTTPSATF